MNPTRLRRIWLIVLLLVVVAIAGSLITFAMQENMTYLFTPSQVKNKEDGTAGRFRLGGVVCEGTMKRTEGTLKVSFSVTDRVNQVIVEHEGILPDMFKEGTSIITTGKMQGTKFVASEVLAKHDETYTPDEIKDMKEVQAAMKKGRELHTKSCGAL